MSDSNHDDPDFQSFMARAMALPEEANRDPNGYEHFAELIENHYNDICVPVDPARLRTHQALMDAEMKEAESPELHLHLIGRRQPRDIDGTPYILLTDALEAFWAAKSNMPDTTGTHGDAYSAELHHFYELVGQLSSAVWNGHDTKQIETDLQTLLFDPTKQENVLVGKYSAQQVIESIVDTAHMHRRALKGSSPEI